MSHWTEAAFCSSLSGVLGTQGGVRGAYSVRGFGGREPEGVGEGEPFGASTFQFLPYSDWTGTKSGANLLHRRGLQVRR